VDFYSGISIDPPIFWKFPEAALPQGYSLKPSPSASGDDCHVEIHGVSANRSKKHFKRRDQTKFEICEKGHPRAITEDDFLNLKGFGQA
jgi:hypothetical protein